MAASGQQVHGPRIIGLGLAFHDALDLAELAPDLRDHGGGGASHRLHGECAEEIGHEAANEEPDDHRRIGEREGDELAGGLEVVGVIGKEHQGREGRGADGVALRNRLGRIADRIQRVGDVAHLLWQACHLRDAACVIGDRPIRIESHDLPVIDSMAVAAIAMP